MRRKFEMAMVFPNDKGYTIKEIKGTIPELAVFYKDNTSDGTYIMCSHKVRRKLSKYLKRY